MARAKRLQGESVSNWLRTSSRQDTLPRGKRMQGTSVSDHVNKKKS